MYVQYDTDRLRVDILLRELYLDELRQRVAIRGGDVEVLREDRDLIVVSVVADPLVLGKGDEQLIAMLYNYEVASTIAQHSAKGGSL